MPTSKQCKDERAVAGENPMNEEYAIELNARLSAIEFAICEIFSVVYLKVPARQIHARHDHWLELARQQGVPGLDPAQSDLLSGELENALHDLSRLIETHVRKPRPKETK
jgi:hypothetical protein